MGTTPVASPCCNADVMELRDSTEYWHVESVEGNEVKQSEYVRCTDISDHRGFECEECGSALHLVNGEFVL